MHMDLSPCQPTPLPCTLPPPRAAPTPTPPHALTPPHARPLGAGVYLLKHWMLNQQDKYWRTLRQLILQVGSSSQ